MTTFDALGKCLLAAAVAFAVLASPRTAHAGLAVLHAFVGGEDDGATPEAGVIRDSAGNLYGTTRYGGGNTGCLGQGCGAVFKLAPDGTETVLYAFTGGTDGGEPVGDLIEDSAGNLFGTTEDGGMTEGGGAGYGTVFELSPGGTETVLYAFAGGSDGSYPTAGLTKDTAGNLYGTTELGGTGCGGYGCGIIFKLAADGTETVLYAFTGGSDGNNPEASLIEDKAGNLYGTTEAGGVRYGTIFKLAPDGTKTILYAFAGGSDAAYPIASLKMDKAGNLYGTTLYGGGSTNCEYGCGAVFELSPGGAETVLHAFTGGTDGAYPSAGLVEDSAGDLYGTTAGGGVHNQGTIFELTPGGTETLLRSFRAPQGANIVAGLIKDKVGTLYGTASDGGGHHTAACRYGGCGTVFKFRP